LPSCVVARKYLLALKWLPLVNQSEHDGQTKAKYGGQFAEPLSPTLSQGEKEMKIPQPLDNGFLSLGFPSPLEDNPSGDQNQREIIEHVRLLEESK
jgi:hypothetical protein